MGETGGKQGNLYISISVGDHELFTRDGFDIHVEVPITLTQVIR